MKKVKIKLTKDEARIMSDNLNDMIQLVPQRTGYPLDSSGDWWYESDRCITGVVTLLYLNSLKPLASCETNKTVTLSLPEPIALAYKLKLSDMKNLFRSDAHEQLALRTFQQIDQAI